MSKDDKDKSINGDDLNYEDLLKSFSVDNNGKEDDSLDGMDSPDGLALSELLEGIKADEEGEPANEDILLEFGRNNETQRLSGLFDKLDELALDEISMGEKTREETDSVLDEEINLDTMDLSGMTEKVEEDTLWDPKKFEQAIEDENIDYASLLSQLEAGKTSELEKIDTDIPDESDTDISELKIQEVESTEEPFSFDFNLEQLAPEENIPEITLEEAYETSESIEPTENTEYSSFVTDLVSETSEEPVEDISETAESPAISDEIELDVSAPIDYNKLVEESFSSAEKETETEAADVVSATAQESEELTGSFKFLDDEEPVIPKVEEKKEDFLGIEGAGANSSKAIYAEMLFEGITMDFDDQISHVTLAELLLSQGKKDEAIDHYKFVAENGGSTYWVEKRLNEIQGK